MLEKQELALRLLLMHLDDVGPKQQLLSRAAGRERLRHLLKRQLLSTNAAARCILSTLALHLLVVPHYVLLQFLQLLYLLKLMQILQTGNVTIMLNHFLETLLIHLRIQCVLIGQRVLLQRSEVVLLHFLLLFIDCIHLLARCLLI